jgi:hypothetical protein
MDHFIKYILGEIRVICGAPLAFLIALSVLVGGAWSAINWRFAEIIESKDGIIALYKERLNGASPDQAKAKIEALEAQVSALRNREWPPLTATASATFKAALMGVEPRQVFIFAEDRDGIFLIRSLIQALNEAGWSAKRDSSLNGVPDGLTVWPADETGRQVRDALANATGLDVNLIDSEYHKHQKQVAIGVGFKLD